MAHKKIGITGHNGFLGTHLKNHINYHHPDFKIIDFERAFFLNEKALSLFVNSCDVIIHIAGLNRNNSEEKVEEINIQLADTLAKCLTKNNFKGNLIYSSSLKELNNSPYGKSKRKAGEILLRAASLSKFSFTSLVIPNIFGPFGKPNYNSFIATFSHQLINKKKTEIIRNDVVPLIYVEKVVAEILDAIFFKGINKKNVPHEIEIKVSDVLNMLKEYQTVYLGKGEIPKLESIFEYQLFNTFRSAIDTLKFFPKKYELHIDERGYFSELLRVNTKGQVSYSITKPGITRGNHFHTRKIERFSVIKGDAKIELRTVGTSNTRQFILSGKIPAYIDIPVWTTHNITNIGEDDLITIFWISEHYDPKDADLFFEKV